MLTVRIIPCLDVQNGKVVKGVQFKNHRDLGSIEEHALFYQEAGADELVFYDIRASCENRSVDLAWVQTVSSMLTIPFCVAGGIKSLSDARAVFNAGADKISINSPALERPRFIEELANEFGSQSIVVGIDSYECEGRYWVYQYTGDPNASRNTGRLTLEWVKEVQDLGAGEVVLNCMNQDGLRSGYSLTQLMAVRKLCKVPLIASGGAGSKEDFLQAFLKADVDGALAASVFHERELFIADLKQFLAKQKVVVRL